MKHLKGKLTLLVVFSMLLFTSCSNEDTSLQENTTNLRDEEQNSSIFQREGISSEISNYLTDYYKSSFTFGKTIETFEGENYYLVTEVVIDSETSARGYIGTNKLTGDFLHFVDVDRTNYILTSVDIDKLETKTIFNIDDLSNYESTDKFDFISTIENINNTPTGKRKFWGSQSSNCADEYVGGGCYQQFCDYDYYVFWINTEHLEHIPTGSMSCP